MDRLMQRFMWWSPSEDSSWMPSVFRGCDEWHNRSIGLVLPFIGTLIVFVGHFDRSGEEHTYCFGSEGYEGAFHPECSICRVLWPDYWSGTGWAPEMPRGTR